MAKKADVIFAGFLCFCLGVTLALAAVFFVLPKPQLVEMERATCDGMAAYYFTYPNETILQVVLPNLTDLQNQADAELDNAISWFNQRYNYTLSKNYTFDNGSMSYYKDGVVHLANRNMLKEKDNVTYVCDGVCLKELVWHEFCHQALDQTCGIFWQGEESFCEVFADSNNTKCDEAKYCSIFRTEEVDRLKFLDCYFKGCRGARSVTYTKECYESHRKLNKTTMAI